MTKRTILFVLSISVINLWFLRNGISSSKELPFYQSPSRASKSLAEILESPQMKTNENIVMETFESAESVSHHLVRIRDREKLHTHETHDLTVVMVKGEGIMEVGEKKMKVAHGSVVFVPRKEKHRYINTGKEPGVALVIFTPAFDGKDRVLVEE